MMKISNVNYILKIKIHYTLTTYLIIKKFIFM